MTLDLDKYRKEAEAVKERAEKATPPPWPAEIYDFCDQEGCSKKATVVYLKKKEYCKSCGQIKQHASKSIRMFCDEHRTRGDCGLDDSDANYEVMEEE